NIARTHGCVFVNVPLAPANMIWLVSHLATLAAAVALDGTQVQATTPTVDLGYEIHSATTNVSFTCISVE
ncbi:hypothetical protein NQU36_26705, partial [Escherichia coli]|uniref:hypothetical protein n=1 Tax=Escherichia coli TaxID=562 RepID=UPI0021178D71